MAKVMLVEDDNNLREIYEARLLAEGYEIVSAQDGEEALALAVKEKPDLIIADIMMPKISGFDMLDILRSTPETKDTKVIMMTALSQSEDKERASKLGADRYLVKSQVTLEDVARVAREVLEGKSPDSPTGGSSSQPPPTQPATPPADPSPPPSPSPTTTTRTMPVAAPPTAQAQPVTAPTSVASTAPANPAADQPAAQNDNNAVLADALNSVGGSNANQPAPTSLDQKTAVHTRVIEPINDLSKAGPNIQDLVAKEEAKEQALKTAQTGATGGAVINDITGNPASDPNSIAL
jgi:CheY-like chemotaxis protein